MRTDVEVALVADAGPRLVGLTPLPDGPQRKRRTAGPGGKGPVPWDRAHVLADVGARKAVGVAPVVLGRLGIELCE